MKRLISLLLSLAMVCSLFCSMASFSASAARERELPTVTGAILKEANYVVSSDTTIYGMAGKSALVVSGNVTITIKKGVKLTVKGGNAFGTTGAGAGIEVPEGSSLTLNGEGTLIATGGKAADGENGENGENGAVYKYFETAEHLHKGEDWCYSGAGGKGGDGGGGAGAGIGGKGGNGGEGGKGGDGLSKYANTDADSSGNDGSDGKPGTAGTGCGNVTICNTLTHTITGGSTDKGSWTVGGSLGHKDSREWHFTYIGFGGGGGGGGGKGYSAANIGSGGAGGGGGGGGGSGIIIHWYYTYDINACHATGEGGLGGCDTGHGGESDFVSNNAGNTPGKGGSGGAAGGGDGVEKSVVYYDLIADESQFIDGNFEYDGKSKRAEFSGNGFNITGGNTAVDAGTHMATAKLWQGYQWPNGSHDEKKVAWTIAKQPISRPSPVTLCYTSNKRVAYTDQPMYTVANVTGIEVGTYTATVTLRNKTNYRWAEEAVDNGVTHVEYTIHAFVDDNHDGICNICGEKTLYLHNAGISYLDKTVKDDNTVVTEKKIADTVRVITEDDTEWGIEGEPVWYVVDKDIPLKYRPVVKGDVRIILKNGTTLTANQGITVEDNNSIRFYAQSDDKTTAGTLRIATVGQTAIGGHTGKVGANGYGASALIGFENRGQPGENGGHAGKVYIYGGNCYLVSEGSACIGGGDGGKGGKGFRDAFGGNAANGGRGGSGGNVNSVYFYGGAVSLKSNIGCIVGGNGGDGGDGGDGPADGEAPNSNYPDHGIGGSGGSGGNVSDVYFYGGTVSFESDGACICGGKGGDGGNGSNSGGKGGRAGNGGDGGNSGKVLFYGGNSTFQSKNDIVYSGGKGGSGGKGCNGSGSTGRDGTLPDGYFSMFGSPSVVGGNSAQNAAATDTYRGQNYISVQYHTWEWLDKRTHRCVDCGTVAEHINDGNGICPLCGELCLVTIPEEAATCGKEGHIVYYQYDGKYYADIDCTQEITDLESWLKTDGSIARLPHTYSDKWSYNEDFHWHSATCGHTGLRADKAEHTPNVDGFCSVCGYDCRYLMATGSIFSKPGFWGIVTVAVIVIGGVMALIIVKKKKKPVS